MSLLADCLNLSMRQLEQAQERHLIGADLTFVLGVEDFLSQQIPSWLSGEQALKIYQEIKDLTMEMVEEVNQLLINALQEFQRQGGRKIDIYDVEDGEADVIKYKAIDKICLKYKIEEEQLKHVLYITYVVPNQSETEFSQHNNEEDGQINEEDLVDTRHQRQSFGTRKSQTHRKY